MQFTKTAIALMAAKPCTAKIFKLLKKISFMPEKAKEINLLLDIHSLISVKRHLSIQNRLVWDIRRRLLFPEYG
mgnify:FL=1